MAEFSYFKAIPYSFFSKSLYQDVKERWEGTGFGYLILPITIAFVLAGILWVYSLNTSFKEAAIEITEELIFDSEYTPEENINRTFNIVEQIPTSVIDEKSKELVIVSNEDPQIIKDPITAQDIIIFDTTGTYRNLRRTDAFVLITEDTISMKKNDHSERTEYFSELILEEKDAVAANIVLYPLGELPLLHVDNYSLSYSLPGQENHSEDEYAPLQPYIINNPYTEEESVIIDPSGNYQSIEDTKAHLLLSEKFMSYYDWETGEAETLYYEDINEETTMEALDKVYSVISTWLSWFVIFALPFIIIFSFLFTIFIILFYGILTVIFANILKVKDISYEDAMRISCVALTPVIFMKTLMPEFMNYQGAVYFLISLGYIIFALKACQEKT